jgi:hypothetical protein
MSKADSPVNVDSAINDDPIWNRFRDAHFIRPGPNMGWVWAAAADFDFVAAGLFLMKRPGFRVDVGSWAMALIEGTDVLVVPLIRLTEGSVEALQPAVAFDIKARRAEILIEQNKAAEAVSLAAGSEYASRVHAAPGHTH